MGFVRGIIHTELHFSASSRRVSEQLQGTRFSTYILGGVLMLALIAIIISSCGTTGSPTLQAKAQLAVGTATLTPVPTFTETAVPTAPATVTPTATPTATPLPPTIAATSIPTDTPLPAATATRRPPTLTPTPVPPTAIPTPSMAFKVIQQAMLSKKENGCEGGGHVYYIAVVDKNGAPLDNVMVRRLYAGNIDIPATGAKGSGKTEDVAPRFAGDRLYVYRDNNTGATYDYQAGQTELTRNLSEEPREIGPEEHVAGGFCDNIADCQLHINQGTLCAGHYSYRVTFQKQ
jgi:hypothetical protein